MTARDAMVREITVLKFINSRKFTLKGLHHLSEGLKINLGLFISYEINIEQPMQHSIDCFYKNLTI